MGVKEAVDSIRQAREDAIQCLRRGEFGYAEKEMRKLYPYMQTEFLGQVVGNFNAANYCRVADLLEHMWKVVEVPDEAAKPAEAAESAVGDVG